ncbi:hypothetical protein A5725_08870 [Mycobacterium kubicae]|uniref:hypothetical protein n=1 Tax=Mycobacterium kubicae TaxID=120959 RepID=UPI0008015B5C|nr:hypothetical protein [Mycobacterium kubicae]OBF23690.1 hypothetical protein A5725_08870 [Mycobacterium kubicae]
MDLYRISHPLRLAKGSHQPGSGKGCAMNVIAYINGDAQITDFPNCSARPLSLLVQACNDQLAGADGYLSPEHTLLALELGWQTVGTAGVSGAVGHAWIVELLTSPTWGVLQYARLTAMQAIIDIAGLHRAAAAGAGWPGGARGAADRAARAMRASTSVAGRYALRAAYESTVFDGSLTDEVIAHALNAHAAASGGASASRIVNISRLAIGSWRQLAGLDTTGDPHEVRVNAK